MTPRRGAASVGGESVQRFDQCPHRIEMARQRIGKDFGDPVISGTA